MHSSGSIRVVVLLGLVIGSFLAAGTQAAVGQFEVGQRWVYEHEGPRPGSMEPNAIDGQRIRQVVAVTEEQGQQRWIIEERFTNDQTATSLLHVNHERFLTAFEIANEKGESATLAYDVPMPYQVPSLEPGEEKTYETTLRIETPKFAMPTTSVIRRLDDETITTPAGEFANCQHYLTKTRSTMNIKIAKIPVTDERDQWYHPSVNGLVKEVYRKDPVKFLAWSSEGYTATSILTSFGVEAVPAARPSRIRVDANAPISEPQADSPAGGATPWIVLVPVAIAAVFLLKRVRRKSPSD